MYTTRSLQRGFTLIELIIFIVVVSVGMVGILSVMNTVVKSSADPMVRKQAAALADSILEEILLKDYCDPDTVDTSTNPPTCGVATVEAGRDTWDNVNDFNGRTIADFVLPSELSSYAVTIAVTDDTTTLGSAPNIPAKKVVVTVSKGADSVSMTGYRANY